MADLNTEDSATQPPGETDPPGPNANSTSFIEASEVNEAKAANGKVENEQRIEDFEESPAKRMKTSHETSRTKGVAPIKAEYLIDVHRPSEPAAQADDDAAEAAGKSDARPAGGRGGKKTKGGQNHSRQFGNSRDAIQLCSSRVLVDEFAEQTCRFGSNCKFEHDIRKYLKEGKREDLETFKGKCPIFEVLGWCKGGWKCRFAGSHSKEIEHDDGRKELILIRNESAVTNGSAATQDEEDDGVDVANVVSIADKIRMRKKQVPTPMSDKYLKWLDDKWKNENKPPQEQKDVDDEGFSITTDGVNDNRARFRDPPLKPSEKRRIYYGPETPILAPLTTQGNLPFRRLCVSLGAQVTWSEMAMALPLLNGEKQEWALMKAHKSEMTPPEYNSNAAVKDYDNGKDLKFGAQIAANKPWLALKTTEVLTQLCPNLRAIDLNCGCPIDLVFRQGAGSALLDTHTKLERILRGMNLVSGEVPITVKIRMGTRDGQPNAEKLCRKLILGTEEAQETNEGTAGVAAIALHGRSRQQRYTRSADWEYIASCASLVKKLKAGQAEVTDTIREPDARDLSSSISSSGMPYFIGNGDILSHVDYNAHLNDTGVDACMVARGALVKPWIFEEIATNQYLDKSATERLGYIEQFVRNGLEYWGSDEIGVGTTRKFLLEWLSFSCRYVPLGILEHLPPKFGDRPPAFRGRSELETLLSSANFKDWIKISEMFLGPAHKDFQFQPKHKSNSYEIEAEG